MRPYPGPGQAIRVSPAGGIEPVWARHGRELYYLEDTSMMAVAIDTTAGFDFEPPTRLFESRFGHFNQPPSYDVAPDGRFIMITSTGEPPFSVILNWTELLRPLGAAE